MEDFVEQHKNEILNLSDQITSDVKGFWYRFPFSGISPTIFIGFIFLQF